MYVFDRSCDSQNEAGTRSIFMWKTGRILRDRSVLQAIQSGFTQWDHSLANIYYDEARN